jgi:hypothetical protein
MQGGLDICQVVGVHAASQLSRPMSPGPQITSPSAVMNDILLLQHTVPVTSKDKQPGGWGRQPRWQHIREEGPARHRVCWSIDTHQADWLLQECGIHPEHPGPPPLQVGPLAAPPMVTNLA